MADPRMLYSVKTVRRFARNALSIEPSGEFVIGRGYANWVGAATVQIACRDRFPCSRLTCDQSSVYHGYDSRKILSLGIQ
jgi:hypothetical protein